MLWLAEYVLGFSRILTFAYGQFFIGVLLTDKAKSQTVVLTATSQVINSLRVLVSLLMSPKKQDPRNLDTHIKLFLSCYQRFATSYYDEESIPFWATKGNFASLLNITLQVEYFGPLWWYWEGTQECYIQTVKTVLVSMLKSISYFERKLALI